MELCKITGQPNTIITKHKGRGKGSIVGIVATGPSHLEAPLQELKGLPKVDFISVNQPDERVWPTKYWMLVDGSMRTFFKDMLKSYEGTVVSSHHPPEVPIKHVIRIKMLPDMRFSRDAVNGLYTAKNSTYIALQWAFYLGYDKIYVFGLDMCAVGDKLYEKPHPWNSSEARMIKFAAEADVLLHIVTYSMTKEEKAKVTLCSPYNKWEFTKAFNYLSPQDAVKEMKAWNPSQ